MTKRTSNVRKRSEFKFRIHSRIQPQMKSCNLNNTIQMNIAEYLSRQLTDEKRIFKNSQCNILNRVCRTLHQKFCKRQRSWFVLMNLNINDCCRTTLKEIVSYGIRSFVLWSYHQKISLIETRAKNQMHKQRNRDWWNFIWWRIIYEQRQNGEFAVSCDKQHKQKLQTEKSWIVLSCWKIAWLYRI